MKMQFPLYLGKAEAEVQNLQVCNDHHKIALHPPGFPAQPTSSDLLKLDHEIDLGTLTSRTETLQAAGDKPA